MGSRWEYLCDCHHYYNYTRKPALSPTNSLHEYVLKNETPNTWTAMSSSEEVQCVQLLSNSSECQVVRNKIRSTFSLPVSHIERIQNPYLWGCYLLKKAEYRARGLRTQELELFHCTSADYVDSIVRDNLDWRLTTRSKFGQGVSFSPKAQYANRYANYKIGTDRVMILCKVLVSGMVEGNNKMILPPRSFDTSLGFGTNVFVKYYDYEFYPMYVAYYTDESMPTWQRQPSSARSRSTQSVATPATGCSRSQSVSPAPRSVSAPSHSASRNSAWNSQYSDSRVPNINSYYTNRSASTSSHSVSSNYGSYNSASAATWPNMQHVNRENDSWCTIL